MHETFVEFFVIWQKGQGKDTYLNKTDSADRNTEVVETEELISVLIVSKYIKAQRRHWRIDYRKVHSRNKLQVYV